MYIFQQLLLSPLNVFHILKFKLKIENNYNCMAILSLGIGLKNNTRASKKKKTRIKKNYRKKPLANVLYSE